MTESFGKQFRKNMSKGLMPLNKSELKFLKEQKPKNYKKSTKGIAKMLEELQRKNKKFMK